MSHRVCPEPEWKRDHALPRAVGARSARCGVAVRANSAGTESPLSPAAVLEYSTQHYDLRRWLRAGGIDPDRDVQTTFIPSPIIHRHLGPGGLDGYCVAEPWNSISVASGAGWIAATSAEIAPGQMEKVLLVLKEFEDRRPEDHQAMVAALIEASSFCESRANRRDLVRMLARHEYLDLPEEIIARSLMGPLSSGRGELPVDEFILFERREANVPRRDRARAIFDQLRQLPAAAGGRSLRPSIIAKLFREDLYRQAEERVRSTSRHPRSVVQHPSAPSASTLYSPEPDSMRMALAG